MKKPPRAIHAPKHVPADKDDEIILDHEHGEPSVEGFHESDAFLDQTLQEVGHPKNIEQAITPRDRELSTPEWLEAALAPGGKFSAAASSYERAVADRLQKDSTAIGSTVKSEPMGDKSTGKRQDRNRWEHPRHEGHRAKLAERANEGANVDGGGRSPR